MEAFEEDDAEFGGFLFVIDGSDGGPRPRCGGWRCQHEGVGAGRRVSSLGFRPFFYQGVGTLRPCPWMTVARWGRWVGGERFGAAPPDAEVELLLEGFWRERRKRGEWRHGARWEFVTE